VIDITGWELVLGGARHHRVGVSFGWWFDDDITGWKLVLGGGLMMTSQGGS